MTGQTMHEWLPIPHRVGRMRRETRDTYTLELHPDASRGVEKFSPGQFNMLSIPGAGEVPISISGDPSAPHVLVHTTRTVGTVTKAINKLKKGDFLGVRGPYGTHWPVDASAGRDILIVAGGIGMAPLRPAVYHLLAHREQYGRVAIIYGTRTPSDILFRPELERWRARFDVDVHITVDRAIAGWRGNVGVVPSLIPKLHLDPAKTVALICGPEIMMRFAVAELHKRGMADDRMFVSLERNMKCGIGLCGHCQYGPTFICKDGPVFPYGRVKDLFPRREL